MTTRLRFVSSLALLAGGGFGLTAVLLPAVTASRAAYAQVFAESAPAAVPASAASAAPAAFPAQPVQPPQPAQSVPHLPPAAPVGAFSSVRHTVPAPAYAPGPPGADNLYAGHPFPVPHAWPAIDPEQAAEVQQIAQEDGKLEVQVREAVGQYHGADSQADRDKLRGQVSELLGQQFVLRQKRRTLELEALEARVKKLREALSKRESSKQTIVDRRLAELLHDDDGLGWGDPGPGFGGDSFRFGPAALPSPAVRAVRPGR